MTRRPHRGAAVVACYGVKDPATAEWLTWLQQRIAATAAGFRPRDLREIHCTIIGLERPVRPVGVSDVLGLRDALAARLDRPLRLRFGGYPAGFDGFRSRGASPHDRTYSTVDGAHVVVGWPADDDVTALASWRRDLERFGFCHRYHRDGGPDDFDAYLVIGHDVNAASAGGEPGIRRLAAGRALSVELDLAGVGVALYDLATLDRGSTDYVPLSSVDADTAQWILDCGPS